MTTFAEAYQEKNKKGIWRRACKDHPCEKVKWDRKVALGCSGACTKRQLYFDTQEIIHGPFKTVKICKACAKQKVEIKNEI